MAQDYRNITSRFQVRGLDLLHTPDGIPQDKWRILRNVENLIDGQLQARPRIDLWNDYTTKEFTTGTCTTPASTLTVNYPYDYYDSSGFLQKLKYVGQVDDNGTSRDAYIFVHNISPTTPWFLNGLPILYDTVWNGTVVTTQAKLSSSTTLGTDDVVVANSPNGQPIVILAGKYYIKLSNLDLNSLDTAVINLSFTTEQNDDYVDCPSAKYIPCYRLGSPAPSTFAVAPAQSATAGNLTQTSGAGKVGGSTKYAWRYTYYDSLTGAETPPTASSTPINITAASKSADMTVVNSTDPQYDKIRIWRKGGVLTGSWRLAKTVSNDASTANQAVNDGASDASIASAETINVELVEPFSVVDVNGTTNAGTKLARCFGPFQDKYVFWFGDSLNPHYVWWCEPNDPFRTTADVNVNKFADDGEEVKKGFIFNGQPYVFTNENLYAMEFAGAEALPAFHVRKTPVEIGCVAKNGVAQGDGLLFFMSRDGIYATDCQSAPTCISDDIRPIFHGQTVEGNAPIDWDQATTSYFTSLTYANKRLYFWYRTAPGSIDSNCLVFDFKIGGWYRWDFARIYSDFGATGTMPEINISTKAGSGTVWLPNKDQSTTLFMTRGFYTFFLDEHARDEATDLGSRTSDYDNQGDPDYSWPGEVLGMICQARTRSADGGIPHTEKLFGTLIIDYDPDGINIDCTPYYDSDETAGTKLDLTNTAGRRVDSYDLGDVYAKTISLEFTWNSTNFVVQSAGGGLEQDENVYLPGAGVEWKYYISGNPKIYAVTILYHVDEEEIVHWQHPEDSFGHHGWFHVRDGFFDINSNANVTLKLTVDGVEYTYTLTSTSGERRKIYQEFEGVRGKVVEIELDSASPFRFYSDSSYIYTKDWQSGLGYEPKPLAPAAGYADFLRKGGGT